MHVMEEIVMVQSNEVIAVDYDDCTRAASGPDNPLRPVAGLGRMFSFLQSMGYLLLVATGASKKSALATEQHLRDEAGPGFRFDFILWGYCASGEERNGSTHALSLAPMCQIRQLRQAAERLDEIARLHGGVVTDSHPVHTAFYQGNRFHQAHQEKQAIVSQFPGLRISAQEHDGGITTMPLNADKSLVGQFCRQRGLVLRAAAGDSFRSDGPMLLAAKDQGGVAIATCGEGRQVSDELRKLVGDDDYVADKPHGHGLLEKLKFAIATGKLRG